MPAFAKPGDDLQLPSHMTLALRDMVVRHPEIGFVESHGRNISRPALGVAEQAKW
jgi:hypothetical protein